MTQREGLKVEKLGVNNDGQLVDWELFLRIINSSSNVTWGKTSDVIKIKKMKKNWKKTSWWQKIRESRETTSRVKVKKEMIKKIQKEW